MLAAAIVMPFLLSVPLHSGNRESTVIILHQGQAFTAAEGLKAVRGFRDDGKGGLIGAAQSSNGKWGYINERGQWIVAPDVDDARAFSDEGLARFQRGGKWGYVNTSGEVVIRSQFEDAMGFSAGLAAVRVGKDQWRYIDRTGKFAFEKTFMAAGSFSPAGLAPAVEAGGKMLCGYIDRTGKWAIKPRFKTSLAFSAEGVAPASLDQNQFGLIDRKGNWVLKPAYPNIREFNADGLAYFDQKNPWENGHGYLDAKGQIAVKGERQLSAEMIGGIACAGSASDGYLLKDGKKLPAPRLSWAGPFNESGYAVVRTADFVWSEALQRHESAQARWGILRNDGSFVPVAEPVLEPLTNADGLIIYPSAGTPISPFLTKDRQVVFLDRDAAVAYRISYENNRASLVDANGAVLWQSNPGDACQAPAPFFHQPIDQFLDQLDSVANVVRSAEAMISESEEKLHRFAEGQSVALPPKESNDENDDDFDEDDDSKDREEAGLVTARRLVRAYISEEHNGYYEFLGRVQEKTVERAGSGFMEALKARFGEPDPDPEHASSRHRYVQITSAWPTGLHKPLDESPKALRESNQLWLGFFDHSDAGDGDEWRELWLICAPSVDALDAARRRRSQTVAPVQPAETKAAMENGDGAPARLPQTYGEWLAEVRREKSAISAVPAGLIDDAMVDAAVGADVEALEYVPGKWQTPARLEALVRKDASTAANIPCRCMTAKALALARSLYPGDQDWRWHDGQRSQLPTEWTKNCLYSVWGGLLNEKHCIKAVSGGESLEEIPHWLRTERVEQAALDADIYNISYIPRERITPQLAARAVRHDYGKLIEHIPQSLLTPELCLISARTNGLSLEQIPLSMRSVDVCVAAMRESSSVFPFVPAEIRLLVSSRLIEADLDSAKKEGEDRAASRWHGYRAWLKLKAADYPGAVDDAKLALQRVEYPQTAHYILAAAYHALGRRSEAALEASTVLSFENPYKPEYDEQEDTQWLVKLAKGQFDEADDATLIAQLKASPRALADIPRARITDAMVEAALSVDSTAIAFVPKRLMTAERYVIALRNRTKAFQNIPPSMIREETCIEFVRESGHALGEVPERWRTVKVCAHALRDSPRVIEHVPEAIRTAAQEMAKSLPSADDEF